MTFKQGAEETRVLFRIERRKRDYPEVTAVMCDDPATNDPYMMTCYAHLGQHGSCSMSWYHITRRATPGEYEELKQELESKPFGYRFKIMSRMPKNALDKRKESLKESV